MKIGVIADDFTGASDIALTLAEAGMNVAQFNGPPVGSSAPDLGAGVISLKSRTAPVEQAIEESLAACDWLMRQGVEQIILKVCSTFDSKPTGNIGPVLDALADRLRASTVAVCPAFPENGRSVYQGHLFVADHLLNESGMENHPLTPMRDADLRRVLARQSQRAVGHVPIGAVQQGHDATEAAMEPDTHMIVDAIRDADLITLGKASAKLPLLCGGSGIALGLPANFGCTPNAPKWTPISGPGVVFSGSCSVATRGQVAAYRALAPSLQIEARQAMCGDYDVAEIATWVLAQDAPPLIYSSADPDVVTTAQAEFGRAESAHAIETFFADLTAELVKRGLKRLVVAGGETSGAVVTALGAHALNIGPRAAPGVPLLEVEGIALALKSGNFGGPNFFADTLALMERAAACGDRAKPHDKFSLSSKKKQSI